jgi:hypothetical protein
MGSKLTRLTHKIAIQLHLVAESCTICSFRPPRRPVRKLLDSPSYAHRHFVAWQQLKSSNNHYAATRQSTVINIHNVVVIILSHYGLF